MLTAVTAAAALIAPLTFGPSARVTAQELPGSADATQASAALLQDQPMGNSDRLRLGVDQYRRGQYEEALATLQQVDASRLAPEQQGLLNDTLAKAEAAANERRAARAAFERGEEALNTGNALEAIRWYKESAANRYADEGTKAKAREQMAVAEAQMRQSGVSLKDIYAQAVADYKAGSYLEARTKFQQLSDAGFKAPMFQRSPSDYLRDIDRRLASRPQPAPQPEPQPEPLPAPIEQPAPAPAVVPEPQPMPLPEPEPEPQPMPVQPEPVQPQPQPEPAPVMPEPQPTPTPQPIEEQPPFIPQPQPQPQPQPVQPAPQPPVEEEPIPTSISREDARDAYRLGKQQFRDGDFIGARRSFEIAQRGGYRPGLFEDSPERWLARIDRQEQAQASGAQRQDTAAGVRVDSALEQTADAATVRREQDRFEANQLVEQADAARAANRPDEALALYSRAADLDPSNNRAVAGMNEMMRVTGREVARGNALDRQAQQVEATRQYIDYSIDTALEEAQGAIARQDWATARVAVTRARNARDTNPGVFTQAELQAYDTAIANTGVAITQAEEAARVADVQEEQEEAVRIQNLAAQRLQRERDDTVRTRIREARTLVEQGRYDEALGVIDQILVLDPGNDYARGVRPLVEDRKLFLDQRKAREEFDRQFTRVLNDAEEQRIPYSDILIYPSNWPDLSEVRERTVDEEQGVRPEDLQVTEQLDKRLPEVHFDQSAFTDVIDFLRDISGANIFVNWRALEAAGIDRTTPVTVARLRDVKLSKILQTVLADVGAGATPLGYTIDEGVITISTEEDLASNVVTRVYDIRDLIINVPDFDDAPDFNLQGSQVGGGGGGQSLFGGNIGGDEQQGALTRQELEDAIIQLIRDTVASESWKENGGTIGAIRPLAGQLIVTQTPENQRELTRLLEQLRETRAIQVTVEARFLVVQRNFLEDIGVDFDFSFNNDDPTDSNRKWSPVVVSQNSFDFNEDLIALDTAIPGNLGLEYSSRQLAPSLSTGFTFLDDFQVSMLIRATQAAQTSSTLTAPRVTLFNGQRAFVLVATETAYVSDLTPIVGTNAVAFDPEPGIVQSGVLLDVVATVSSDRKYVTLTLRPTLSRLRDLVQFPVSALSATGGGTGGDGTVVEQTAFLQQPVRDITTVRTTVSVPDGGTLMIGGQTLNGEVERESGVPVLSKIPFLKRLFTNRSTAKDDQILLILIRPTIIIQREREAEQFPLLNSR